MADMDAAPHLVHLSDIRVGVCAHQIFVKVDRVIFKEVVRFPLGRHRPMVEQDAIHIVVFDERNTRGLLVLDDRTIICRFAHMFCEQRSFRISHFDVMVQVPNNQHTLHIKLRLDTVLVNLPSSMPHHSFDLITVPHVNTGAAYDSSLLDVCGFLIAIYDSGMVQIDGILRREVTILLEDSGVLALGGRTELVCRMHGVCADNAMSGYEAGLMQDPLFIVVQYARAVQTSEGEPTLMSYCNATRVFFNPSFPEILEQRVAMLG